MYLLMWMSQVVVRVVEPAMERVPDIVMVAIVCQSLASTHEVCFPAYTRGMARNVARTHGHKTFPLFFARRVWLARLTAPLRQWSR